VREAEEQDDDLALEIRKRAPLPRMVGQIELFAPLDAGDVRELELGSRALTAARRDEGAREQRQDAREARGDERRIREECGSNDRRAARRKAPTGT
jgi:hypothetical protein